MNGLLHLKGLYQAGRLGAIHANLYALSLLAKRGKTCFEILVKRASSALAFLELQTQYCLASAGSFRAKLLPVKSCRQTLHS